MAEFQEVAKMYDRLCESYDECYKCPMFRNGDKNDPIACRYWTLIVDPETAEEVILQWGKKHPIKAAQEERKKGKWIVHIQRGNWSDREQKTCSECRMTFVDLDVANFCPNCGVRMEDNHD